MCICIYVIGNIYMYMYKTIIEILPYQICKHTIKLLYYNYMQLA
jgi:hypothetical protein